MNKRKLLNLAHATYSELVYRAPEGLAPPPPLIVWEISNKCNLKCSMCALFGDNKIDLVKGNELSLDEIKNIINSLEESYKFLPYKPFIGITGGEPFMKRDIIEVFNYLKKKNFKFSITTNFSIPTKKQISDLIDSGIQDLRVSIDGPEDIHNKIRGVNIFKRVIDNLKFVRSHKKGKDLPIKLNCTISRANMHHIQELIGIASELKADLSYQFLEFVDDKHFHAHSKVSISKLGAYYPTKVDRGTLNKEETETIITQLNKAKKLAEEKGVKLLFTPDITDNNEIREYHLNINYLHTDACKFPWGAARINSYGDVFPCIDYIYGNLRKSSFSKVWNNKRARYFRRTLKKSKLFPGCIRCCKI